MKRVLFAWLATVGMVCASDLASIESPALSGEVIRPADPGEGPFAVLVFVTDGIAPLPTLSSPSCGAWKRGHGS